MPCSIRLFAYWHITTTSFLSASTSPWINTRQTPAFASIRYAAKNTMSSNTEVKPGYPFLAESEDEPSEISRIRRSDASLQYPDALVFDGLLYERTLTPVVSLILDATRSSLSY
jgi:hypothetical protein